jgi:ABC-type glycerol-3-phosphate transport system substrate-binding protein
MRSRVLALAVVVLASGCGGGSSATYAVGPTQTCLQHKSVQVSRASRDVHYFWQTAPQGALTAKLGGTPVTIDFEQTHKDADTTKSAYEAGAPSSTTVEEHGNVILIWRQEPSSTQRSTVKACLSE